MSPTIASYTTKRDLIARRPSAARCNADSTALWPGLISLDAALSSERVTRCASGPWARRSWMAQASGAIAELRAQHPLLVLERAHDVDQHVLRDRVALGGSVHALARSLTDLRDPISDGPYHGVALGRLGRDRRQR